MQELEKEGVVEEVEEGVKKVEKKIERRPKVTAPKPAGRVPVAMVIARHGTGTVTRSGRGFSFGELSGVGLAPRVAANWGVRIDPRRRSVIEGNVNLLRGWQSHPAHMAKVEGEVKIIQRGLEKAGKEIEKQGIAVEKEAVKLEKAVKKEVKKARKAVKKKVEKPRGRPKKKKS